MLNAVPARPSPDATVLLAASEVFPVVPQALPRRRHHSTGEIVSIFASSSSTGIVLTLAGAPESQRS